MWFNPKSFMLLLTTLLFTLQKTCGAEYSNSTALSVIPDPDDDFYGMPVYYKTNLPVEKSSNKTAMSKRIQDILEPLSPYIVNDDRRVAVRVRRQDGGAAAFGAPLPPPEIVQVEDYRFSFIAAAQIGDYTFSCRQTNGDLVIFNPTLPVATQTRALPAFTEFQLHPRPGVWWWVICVTFESGGAGLGVTGVQRPGGDAGVNPNALKSLVG